MRDLFTIKIDMINQQHNQGPPQQLLNVQRPQQIQPPSGQHRMVPQGQNQMQSQNQMPQQNQIQQGQHMQHGNMGQPSMSNMQGQRQPGPSPQHLHHQQPGPSPQQMRVPSGQNLNQPGPSPQHMQNQPGPSSQHVQQNNQSQGHMMNMGQQMRPQQGQQQPQMMQQQQVQQSPQQQQMRPNPQQQHQMRPQQGQMQSQQNQQGQMQAQQHQQGQHHIQNQQQPQMRMQQQNQQPLQHMNTPPQQQRIMQNQNMQQSPIMQQGQQNMQQPQGNMQQPQGNMQQQQGNLQQGHQNMQQPQGNMQQNQNMQQGMRMVSPHPQQGQRMVPQQQMQMQSGPQQMNRPSPQQPHHQVQMQQHGVQQQSGQHPMNGPSPQQQHHQVQQLQQGGQQQMNHASPQPQHHQIQHGPPQRERIITIAILPEGPIIRGNRIATKPYPDEQNPVYEQGPSEDTTARRRMPQSMSGAPPPKQMRMQQAQQPQQDSQMQQQGGGQIVMNSGGGPPQQHQSQPIRVVQAPQNQQNLQRQPPPRQQMPLQQQIVRVPMQNSAQQGQIRMAPQGQGQQQQPPMQQQLPQQQAPMHQQQVQQPPQMQQQMHQQSPMHQQAPAIQQPQQMQQNMQHQMPQHNQPIPNGRPIAPRPQQIQQQHHHMQQQEVNDMNQPPVIHQQGGHHQRQLPQGTHQQQPNQHGDQIGFQQNMGQSDMQHQDIHQQDNQPPPLLQQQQPMQQQMISQTQSNQETPRVNEMVKVDTEQEIHIQGETAVINGVRYKLVQQGGENVLVALVSNPPSVSSQSSQPDQSNQQQRNPGSQQNQQQRNGPQQYGQQGQQNQQSQQHQQSQNINTNQQGGQNHQMPMQQNMQNMNMQNLQQAPPVLQQQQPRPPAPRKRNRAKKNNTNTETAVLQADTPVSEALKMMPSEMIQQNMPKLITPPVKGNRKTNLSGGDQTTSSTPPPGQGSLHGPSQVPNGAVQQQPIPQKNMGPAMHQQPPRNGSRHPPPMRQQTQKPNGMVQNRTAQLKQAPPPKPVEEKENLTEIREAIILHCKGTQKMTPKYKNYVIRELSRILQDLEKLNLTWDRRYTAVQNLMVLIEGDPNVPFVKLTPREHRFIEKPKNDVEPDPEGETEEEKEERHRKNIEKLVNAYPEPNFGVTFKGLDLAVINKEKEFYRKEDMKNREAYLRENIDTFSKDKQMKAKIEYLGLGLRDLQSKLRAEVLSHTTLVPPTEFLINPYSIRRTKAEYALELKQHPDRAALEKKRRATNMPFLHAVQKHARDFKEFHRRNLNNHRKVHKSMQQYISNEAKRVAREEQRVERMRIQKLIQEDEVGYRAMLDEKKDQRLVYLLEQTDEYIKSLCDLLKQQQDSVNDGAPVKKTPQKEYEGLAEDEKAKAILEKARNEDDDYDEEAEVHVEDYYTTAHGIREEIKEQHSMMGDGNPVLKLKPYQIKGLEWMVSLYNNNLNGILADEMGLGKTIQTIAFITYLMQVKKNPGPYLVIVPLSTVPNWQNEFDKWAPGVHLIVFKGSKENRKSSEPIIKSGKFNVLLTTFEYVIREKALLGKLRWKYMMIDEGHRLKNQHCKLTEMLNTRFQCQRRLLITGTPLQNKLPELWALLNFLLPSIFQSCASFEQWFNAPFQTSGEKVELTSEETMLIIRRLHKVLRPFLLRRLKKEVESELPDKMEFVIKCEMSALQKVLYKHMQKGLLLDGKTNTGSRSLMNTMVHLRKLCNHPFLFENVEDSCKSFWKSQFISAKDLYRVSGKLELLDRILPKLQASGHRVLMFFQMTAMMTIVEDYLAGGNIQYLRLDGSTKPDERGALLDKFNAPNSEYFLFMLSTRAGGLGLNLQTADTVIIFDSDWNPHQDMQAQDRAHRIGQKAEVRVFRLITANSVEEKILASARFKLNVDEKVIQAGKFDNRSTGAERRQILENIIKADNESAEDEDVPNDEEINDMISRSEDEFDMFQKMDEDRVEADKRRRAKPRLCDQDEIPKDILRAADETDYIEKAKEEGRVAYLEVMPGSRRARKEVDYSTDTMSDDKFLEKLFESDDDTSSRREENQSTPSTSETPKKADDAVFATPKPPTMTFKVPKLVAKPGDIVKRRHSKSEGNSDDHKPKKVRQSSEGEGRNPEERSLKRSSEKISKSPLTMSVVAPQTIDIDDDDICIIDEVAPTKAPVVKPSAPSVDESPKLREEDYSTPKKKKRMDSDGGERSSEKKKKKHRDRDEEGSSERKKKRKEKHLADMDAPSKPHHKKHKDLTDLPSISPLASDDKKHKKKEKDPESSKKSMDLEGLISKIKSQKPTPEKGDQPSSSSSKPTDDLPPLKLKLNFKMPPPPIPPKPQPSDDLVVLDDGTPAITEPKLSLKFKLPSAEKSSPEKPTSVDTNKEPKLKLKFKIPTPEKISPEKADVAEPKLKLKVKVPKENSDATPVEKETPLPKLKFKLPTMTPEKSLTDPVQQLALNLLNFKAPDAEKSTAALPTSSEKPKLSLKFKVPPSLTPEKPAKDVTSDSPKLSFKVNGLPGLTPEKTAKETPEMPKLSLKIKPPTETSDVAAPAPELPKLKFKVAAPDTSAPTSEETPKLSLKFKMPSFTPEMLAPSSDTPTKPADVPSTSETPKLSLKFKMPSFDPTTVAESSSSGSLPSLKLKLPSFSEMMKPTSSISESEHADVKEKKKKKEHKEHKRKSHEGETEEERRARKEAKRLKKEAEGDKDDDVKRQEKAAKKAAKKELKRLAKEQNATGEPTDVVLSNPTT
ncbi:hypothetical protein B9Z55_024057 [Caenorhabditis nigoni]|uniref:Uncharacterized protein n=2 Tax=Caenorhabditis nigoni TaxID=1611254 RepID=A0A2G5SSA0_9PELO|nr:hypothetical protein B9Z55_024057 [Caenorhabditis nigoni]